MAKILVIEDEMLLREEVAEWLTVEGHEALCAADGAEGVVLAAAQLPDVILCDIAMPRMDGYAVMLEIRADPHTQLMPFIFMTAKATQEDIRIGMTLGADDYITKPFTYRDVMQAIQTRLDKKALQEERKQAEIERWQQALEQEHELRLFKSRMVAMFAHDFRNSLGSILTSNGTLRDFGDRLSKQRQLTYFHRIEASVHQLTHMLDDMLTVAQIESGSLDFRPEPLDITQFVQQVLEEFQLIHQETHVIEYKSQFPDSMMADPRLLRQIISNLVSNAVKYSPKGSIVRLSLQRQDRHIELTVQDYGIGIPEADLHRLFETFQRAENVGAIPGTGLGLAIAKQAIVLHGGDVDLKSQVGVGTTVTVRFPI